MPGYPCCCKKEPPVEPCSICSGEQLPTPKDIQVVTNTIVNDKCPDCGSLNDTWIVNNPRNFSKGGKTYCAWDHEIDPAICMFAWITLLFYTEDGDFYLQLYFSDHQITSATTETSANSIHSGYDDVGQICQWDNYPVGAATYTFNADCDQTLGTYYVTVLTWY
jgi:hypothetical protein